MTEPQVVDIRAARSYVPGSHTRLVSAAAMGEILGVSAATVKNYARGGYFRDGEYHVYPQGKMPSLKLHNGQLRFDADKCLKWLESVQTP